LCEWQSTDDLLQGVPGEGDSRLLSMIVCKSLVFKRFNAARDEG
jgi:hypothetical protein